MKNILVRSVFNTNISRYKRYNPVKTHNDTGISLDEVPFWVKNAKPVDARITDNIIWVLDFIVFVPKIKKHNL